MKLEFYKCAHCGNVAVKLFDQGVPLSCCGEEMTLLRAGETDGAAEKHVPVVTVGETIHVEVGSVLHPMMEAHFITMIVLETSKGFQVKHLQPGEEPKADFAVVPGEEPVAVYEYCNVAGFVFCLFASLAGRPTWQHVTGRPPSTSRANCSTRVCCT